MLARKKGCLGAYSKGVSIMLDYNTRLLVCDINELM